MGNYIIRKMTLSDVNLIEKNFTEDFDNFWNIDVLKQEIQNNNTYYLCVSNNIDGIIGFAGLLRVLDEATLMNIVIRNDLRDQGIGSDLLENLIKVAKDFRCTSLTLEVNVSNEPAIKLYEKFDFKKVGSRKKYYNNTYDAIIMTKLL